MLAAWPTLNPCSEKADVMVLNSKICEGGGVNEELLKAVPVEAANASNIVFLRSKDKTRETSATVLVSNDALEKTFSSTDNQGLHVVENFHWPMAVRLADTAAVLIHEQEGEAVHARSLDL